MERGKKYQKWWEGKAKLPKKQLKGALKSR